MIFMEKPPSCILIDLHFLHARPSRDITHVRVRDTFPTRFLGPISALPPLFILYEATSCHSRRRRSP